MKKPSLRPVTVSVVHPMNVIDSCRTLEQLHVAQRYVQLWIARTDASEALVRILVRHCKKRLEEVIPEMAKALGVLLLCFLYPPLG